MGWYVLITKGQNRGEIGYIIDPLTLNSVKTISIAETCLKLGINYTVEHITLCGQEHGSIVIISELEIIQIQIKDFIEEYTIKNDDIFSKYSQKWKYNKLLQQKIKLENRDTTVSPLQIQENIINEQDQKNKDNYQQEQVAGYISDFDINPNFTRFDEKSGIKVTAVADHTTMLQKILSCDIESGIMIALESDHKDLNILQWDKLEKFNFGRWQEKCEKYDISDWKNLTPWLRQGKMHRRAKINLNNLYNVIPRDQQYMNLFEIENDRNEAHFRIFKEFLFYFFDNRYQEFNIMFMVNTGEVYKANYQIIEFEKKWNLLRMKKCPLISEVLKDKLDVKIKYHLLSDSVIVLLNHNFRPVIQVYDKDCTCLKSSLYIPGITEVHNNWRFGGVFDNKIWLIHNI